MATGFAGLGGKLSNDTFSDISGGVSDLFSSSQKAAGLRLNATGLRIQAQAGRLKAAGDIAEGENYDRAAVLANQNEQFTEQSTAVKQVQADRAITMGLGEARADVAGSGFTQGGTALDILRDSAAQGALQKQILGQQGLITEAGYKEQADSFTTLSGYAKFAANQENLMATETEGIADETNKLARTTETEGYISSGLKFAAAAATLA